MKSGKDSSVSEIQNPCKHHSWEVKENAWKLNISSLWFSNWREIYFFSKKLSIYTDQEKLMEVAWMDLGWGLVLGVIALPLEIMSTQGTQGIHFTLKENIPTVLLKRNMTAVHMRSNKSAKQVTTGGSDTAMPVLCPLERP
jgi:hypothetical protein